MIEQLIPWMPINNLAHKYSLMRVSNDAEGFNIFLSAQNNNSQVRISFPDYVRAHKLTSTVLSQDSYSGSKFWTEWTFFKVKNSSYIQWLYEESLETLFNRDEIIHFSLITENFIIDIVDYEDPIVEMIS